MDVNLVFPGNRFGFALACRKIFEAEVTVKEARGFLALSSLS